ncbi:MAG: hypothetical protein CR975_01365 [Gammaproteobacteria bacterium]|nr:MAG: hypothetical protein CR975_01365 [Gammaproteobacteria bacterium]
MKRIRKINQIMATIIVTQGMAFAALAADKVDISPVVSNGGKGGSGNEPSNMWITLDQSGSMGKSGKGWDEAGKVLLKENTLTQGYIKYKPYIKYKVPVDYRGNKLPLPEDENKTYVLDCPHNNNSYPDKKHYYQSRDIFVAYAQKELGVEMEYGGGYDSCHDDPSDPEYKKQEVLISDTYVPFKWDDSKYKGGYAAAVKPETSCEDAADKKNCQIWKTYYSSRLLALKSGVALAMYKNLADGANKDKPIRFGYQMLKNVDHLARGFTGNRTLPVKANTEANRREFYQWLFAITVGSGTPMRGTVSAFLNKLKESGWGGSSTGNIYLQDPSKPYNKDTNKALTCRHNHNIIFTDGEWNGTPNHDVVADLGEYAHVSTESSSILLPDGKEYKAMTPYRVLPDDMQDEEGVVYLADMAFRSWVTDLDGKTDNNKKDEDGALLIPEYEKPWDEQEGILTERYKNKEGDAIVYANHGSPYWHPFYDFATWQHINTHTIGFGLNEKEYKDIKINPPYSIEAANGLDDTFGLNSFIEGTAKWKKGTSGHKGTVLWTSLAVADLARAAVAGRGLFFHAKGGDDITKAFDAIIARASDKPEKTAAKSGSAGTSSGSRRGGNSYYATRFDGTSFTGDLVRKALFNGTNGATCFNDWATNKNRKIGEACNQGGWSAARILSAMSPSGRNIITAKRQLNGTDLSTANVAGADINQLTYKTVDLGDYSPYQKDLLEAVMPEVMKANFPDENNRLDKLFAYIRGEQIEKGDNNLEAAGTVRNRNEHEFDDGSKSRSILGATVRSSAVVAAKPSLVLRHLNITGSAYTDYLDIVNSYRGATPTRKDVVYIGANDGMLHAFDAKDGKELFAYVPASIYDGLAKTVLPNKQVSLVDGKIRIEWVNLGGDTSDDNQNDDWQQMLVGGFAGGGKGLYSLNVTGVNVTNDSVTDVDAVKDATQGNWEYGELESRLHNGGTSNMGNIMWEADIVQLHDNTWVAITGNGYNSESGKAALIVIDLATGKPIQELELPESNQPNGLGPLYFAAYPKDDAKNLNKADRAYAGDLQGNLWVFDLTGSGKSGGITIANNKPLFTAKATDASGEVIKVDGKEIRLPITASPMVVKHPTGMGNLVHFGTGAMFSQDDLSSKVPNAIYAIWDDWIPADKGGLSPDERGTTVKESELNSLNLAEKTVVIDGKDVRVRYLQEDQSTEWKLSSEAGVRGWRIKLIADKTGNERAWQTATMSYGARNTRVVKYRTVRYIETEAAGSCGGGEFAVEGWDLVFNPKDAGKGLPAPAMDVNNDNVINLADAVNDDGQQIIPNGFRLDGTFGYNEDQQTTEGGVMLNGSSSVGTVKPVFISFKPYMSSWKELKSN